MGSLSFVFSSRFLRALLARSMFAIHGIITIWRVTDVYSESIYYLLVIPVCLIPLEMILTLKFTDSGEWKWLCPSVLLYLASVIPGVWFLQFDLYNKRITYRDSMGWRECSPDTVYNTSNIRSSIGAFQVSVSLTDDSRALALEQMLLTLLIVGRWLLPRGSLTRDQLSQLLLVYIGMAADILEFSLESLIEQAVMCNRILIIVVLGTWNWSLLQFTLVLTSSSAQAGEGRPAGKRSRGGWLSRHRSCSENEFWALLVTVVMQDGPLLAVRLYLLIKYSVMNQMMLFFLIKNILVILLQLYRMAIVCCDGGDAEADVEARVRSKKTTTTRKALLMKSLGTKKKSGNNNAKTWRLEYRRSGQKYNMRGGRV